jgi:hypothetical protein
MIAAIRRASSFVSILAAERRPGSSSKFPDDVLERAASTEQNALTMLYCTNDWYSCSLPQIPAF